MGDPQDYASYELAADDEAFVGDSIADALHAACQRGVERYGVRVRAARGTAPNLSQETKSRPTPDAEAKQTSARRLRVATHCASLGQFIGRFHPFCSERSIFVAQAKGEVGSHIIFSFDLEGGSTAFCGVGIVNEQSAFDANRFGRPGVSISVTRLHPGSQRVFAALLAARQASG